MRAASCTGLPRSVLRSVVASPHTVGRQGGKTMTSQQTQAEQNKAVVRRFVEESNRVNLSAYDQLLADNFVDHSAPPGYPNDREGQKQFAAMLHVAFPAGMQAIDDLISEGDKVVMRWTARGTHAG